MKSIALSVAGLLLLMPLILPADTSSTPASVQECRMRAAAGDAAAQYNLGVMYANGRGVVKDEAEAVRWYRKAAEQGDADAQYNLAIMFKDGRGVEKDEAEAVRWYRKAAEQGKAAAQVNLAIMYEDGRGVGKDEAEAVRWYRIAAEQGSVEAQRALERLELEQTAHERPLGKATRENWTIDLRPEKDAIYYLDEQKMKTHIIGWTSDETSSMAVVIRADDGSGNYSRQFHVGILGGKHDYAEGDPLEEGFYRHIGVMNVQGTRIRAFEEVEIPEQIRSLYMP